MTQAQRTEHWRAIFAQLQARQLEEWPLSPLDSPLERAKRGVAFRFFGEKHFKSQNLGVRPQVFEADNATRGAFFDRFGFERSDIFCLKSEGFDDVFKGRRNFGGSIWPYSRCYHLFSDLQNDELSRRWGRRDHARAGIGGADLWRFDGKEKLIFVRRISGWVS
jgi:hypothetical protein